MDGLEREVEDRAVVIRLNVSDPEAAPLVSRHRVFVTPTFIVFDTTGNERWRQSGSVLNRGAAREALGLD